MASAAIPYLPMPGSPTMTPVLRRVRPTATVPARYAARSRPSRLVGTLLTALVYLVIAGVAMLRFHDAAPLPPMQAPLVVNLLPVAAPPSPPHDRAPGPLRTEQTKAAARLPAVASIAPPVMVARPTVAGAVAAPPSVATAAATSSPATAPIAPPLPPALWAGGREPDFAARLLRHIERFRRYPASAKRMGVQGVAHVRLTMDRTGGVVRLALGRSSGSGALDRAAIDTLRRAAPLPPIPDDLAAPLNVVVPIEFILEQE